MEIGDQLVMSQGARDELVVVSTAVWDEEGLYGGDDIIWLCK